MQKYIHRETKEIVEAEQVLNPQNPKDEEYTERHGELHVPAFYWKIFRNGAPRQTAPNDFLFKKMYKSYSEEPEAPTKKKKE